MPVNKIIVTNLEVFKNTATKTNQHFICLAYPFKGKSSEELEKLVDKSNIDFPLVYIPEGNDGQIAEIKCLMHKNKDSGFHKYIVNQRNGQIDKLVNEEEEEEGF